MLRKLKENIRGFSMVEVLAIIVIIGIIAGVGIPAALNYIQTSRQDSFFESVTEIVNAVSESNSLNGASYCVYEDKASIITTIESKGITEKTEDIENLYIYTWVNSDGKKLYAVSAKSKETGATIDTTDFYSLSMKNKKSWDNGSNDYNTKINEILASASDITNYQKDLVKCELGGTR